MFPIVAKNLVKQYGAFEAVKGISFSVQPGECVGFLGPNGAGKTTTIRMITSFTPLTAGEVQVFGLDVSRFPREVKSQLGICPQDDSLDPDFNVLKNLLMYARYFGMKKELALLRANELLEFVQLTEKRNSAISSLSGGMKRRLVLARALMNQPKLLILDEPTTGLDPQVRQIIWQKIRQLRKEGVTVLLTTHYMEEASQLCDRVILMDQGKILLEGKPENLILSEIGLEVVELPNPTQRTRDFIKNQRWAFESTEERIYVFDSTEHTVAKIMGDFFPEQERFIRRATLEDVFLRKAGRTLRE